MSDNYRFRVDGETFSEFEAAIKLAFRWYTDGEIRHNGLATHFAITPIRGMILYDYSYVSDIPKEISETLEDSLHNSQGKYPLQKFLFPMYCDDMTNFGWRWLQNKDTVYPKEPDHDGDNHKGFSVFNEAWGHVNHDHHAFAAIKPDWQMYGK